VTITLYGIPNCDTVKKARVWLGARGVDFSFHDYKKAGADAAQIARWVDVMGWEKVLNRAGTTFKKLPDADKTDLDAAKAVAICAANPSAIKRPIVEKDGTIIAVGFKEAEWDALF
jgi:Spx/MgsR family transcriptional regulator